MEGGTITRRPWPRKRDRMSNYKSLGCMIIGVHFTEHTSSVSEIHTVLLSS
jgi:hypothetical protein